MAGRTNTDAIRELERSVAMLTERLDNVREDVRRLSELVDTALEKSREETKHLHEALAAIDTRIALADERHQNLARLVERSERREWQIRLLVLASLLTLVANIAVVVIQRVL